MGSHRRKGRATSGEVGPSPGVRTAAGTDARRNVRVSVRHSSRSPRRKFCVGLRVAKREDGHDDGARSGGRPDGPATWGCTCVDKRGGEGATGGSESGHVSSVLGNLMFSLTQSGEGLGRRRKGGQRSFPGVRVPLQRILTTLFKGVRASQVITFK